MHGHHRSTSVGYSHLNRVKLNFISLMPSVIFLRLGRPRSYANNPRVLTPGAMCVIMLDPSGLGWGDGQRRRESSGSGAAGVGFISRTPWGGIWGPWPLLERARGGAKDW